VTVGEVVAVEEGRAGVWLLVGVAVLGSWALYNGVQTWRGRELRTVIRAQRRDPDAAARWIFGGRRRYQTFIGASLSGIPAGVGFLLIAAGIAIRDALDKPLDWGPWYALAIAGTVLIGVAFLYQLAYFWTGVPDWLRPPSQRGQPEPDDPAGHRRARHRRVGRALRRPYGDERPPG